MAIQIRKILRSLYPKRCATNHPGPARSRTKYLFYVACVFALAHVILLWYYYNRFVSLQYDVEESQAQIDTQLQRRKNVILNLTIMVEDYAKHERGIFEDIAELRAAVMGANGGRPPPRRDASGSKQIEAPGQEPKAHPPDQRAGPGREPGAPPGDPKAPGKAPAAPTPPPTVAGRNGTRLPLVKRAPPAGATDLASGALDVALSRIFAVAERYPTLKLNENFQRFMQALVDAENNIAEQRMIYNERANTLSTALGTFPGNVYGRVYRFAPPAFFEPETDARASPKVRY